MEPKERIITEAEQLFFRYGIKNITMDEMARHMGMSKKTIYLYFKDKDDLVSSVTSYAFRKHELAIDEITAKSIDPVDEVLKISEYIKIAFKAMNPTVLFDIQRFYPKAWQMYCLHKENCIQSSISINLKKGIEEGYYRNNLDVEIISKLRMEEINIGYNPIVFPPEKFDSTKVQVEFLEHFLYGICTLKGHKLINKYKQINEED